MSADVDVANLVVGEGQGVMRLGCCAFVLRASNMLCCVWEAAEFCFV